MEIQVKFYHEMSSCQVKFSHKICLRNRSNKKPKKANLFFKEALGIWMKEKGL